MFLAMQGQWGTHYDVLPPEYSGPTTLWARFAFIGLIPQLILWVGFTITVGVFVGGIVTAAARRRLSAAPAEAK
jgi:hypothetical protein